MAKIKKQSALLGVFVVALLAGIWKFVWQPASQTQLQDNASEATNVESATPLSQPVPQSPASTEEIGEQKKVSVKTDYKNPGGSDEVGFTLLVDQEGVITNASVEVLAKNPTSKKRQEAFAADLPKVLQGKKLADLSAIDKVGGSSLTTSAFNASLAQLKAGL